MNEPAQEVVKAYCGGAEAYGKAWQKPHEWMAMARQTALQRLSGPSDIVDVGCGLGHDSDFWSQAGHRVIGIDACPEMIDAARANYPRIEFVELNLLSLGSLGR